MTTTPLTEATYVLSIVADSGYESTMEGRCDAEQYTLAVKALHEPAQARADLEAENARLREALSEAADDIESWGAYADAYFQKKHDLAGCVAKYRATLEKQHG